MTIQLKAAPVDGYDVSKPDYLTYNWTGGHPVSRRHMNNC